MDFEAIKQALVTMGQAMVAVVDRLDRQREIDEEILIELKKLNDN